MQTSRYLAHNFRATHVQTSCNNITLTFGHQNSSKISVASNNFRGCCMFVNGTASCSPTVKYQVLYIVKHFFQTHQQCFIYRTKKNKINFVRQNTVALKFLSLNFNKRLTAYFVAVHIRLSKRCYINEIVFLLKRFLNSLLGCTENAFNASKTMIGQVRVKETSIGDSNVKF